MSKKSLNIFGTFWFWPTVILALVIMGYFFHFIIWIPIIIYLLVVYNKIVKVKNDYGDWKELEEIDYKNESDKIDNDFAGRGLTFSGIRQKAVKEFKEKRRLKLAKREREFRDQIINSLLFK